MAILTKEQILSAKTNSQTFKSDFWGGEIEYRLATTGDKINARQKARAIAEMMGDKDPAVEHFELGLILVCVVAPKLEIPDVVELANQNATEISKLGDAIVRRPTGKDPTK